MKSIQEVKTTFPKNFEIYMRNAVQELGEKIYRFNPDILFAILRSGRLVGFSVQYYLELMYDKKIPLDYIHATRGISDHGHKFPIINELDLKQKEGVIRKRRIAVLDDYGQGTIGYTKVYIREHLNPSAMRGFCLYNSTCLRRLGRARFDEQWHDFLSENSGFTLFLPIPTFDEGKCITFQEELERLMKKENKHPVDESQIEEYQTSLKRIKEAETVIRELIKSNVQK
jgi:hypoxanthine phosphoribosyltransferase